MRKRTREWADGMLVRWGEYHSRADYSHRRELGFKQTALGAASRMLPNIKCPRDYPGHPGKVRVIDQEGQFVFTACPVCRGSGKVPQDKDPHKISPVFCHSQGVKPMPPDPEIYQEITEILQKLSLKHRKLVFLHYVGGKGKGNNFRALLLGMSLRTYDRLLGEVKDAVVAGVVDY